MVDQAKTKRELLDEVESLKHRVAELEQLEEHSRSAADNGDLFQVLRVSEKKYRTLFEDSNDAIVGLSLSSPFNTWLSRIIPFGLSGIVSCLTAIMSQPKLELRQMCK